jgi:AraC family transcriptional regulator, transcriptional activator FtrA
MSRFTRFAVTAAAVLALPGVAAVLGLGALEKRDHPNLLPRLDASTIAAVPRPALDPAKPTVVVLLGTDLTEITDALGPYEMFARAGRYNVVTAAAMRQPAQLTGGLRILPHYALAELDAALGGSPAVVVVPNLPNAAAPMNRPVIDWIRAQAAGGSLIHSWCKGAMALAETGLLDGQTATAHWGDIPALEKRYPKVTWVRGVRWIDRGQYVMSAGITSGIDASLRVLIRIAGDSVARRVAREIRYPNYQFALNPAVPQYTLQPADLVLLANAAFRLNRPVLGIAMYDGVGEIDLSNVYDAHVHTMVVRVETLAESQEPVVTAHGLTLYPSLPVASAPLRRVDRIIVPGPEAPERAASLAAALASAAPRLRPDYVHAREPRRFGLEPVIEDLAQTADVATARFALKRMEYRAGTIRFDGSALPLVPLGFAVALALAGLALTGGTMRLMRTLSESDRNSSQPALTRVGRPILRWLWTRTQRGNATMSNLTRFFIFAAAVALPALVTSCVDSPVAPVTSPPPAPPTIPTTPRTVASITLDAADVSIDEGADRQLVATPRDAQGVAISGIAVTWTSSDRGVAEVGPAGRVSGIRVGTAVLTASAHGRSVQASVTVRAHYPYDLLYTVRTFDIFQEVFRLDVRQAGGQAARLFPASRWASQARPSPDGSRIAYVCPSPIFGDGSICVANRDGSDSSMIAGFIGDEFREPTWSPDGKRLAYVRTRNDGIANRSHIWVVNADGSNPVPLTESLAGNQNMPAWSPRLPDGTERIAFVQELSSRPRIWTVRSDGSSARPVGSVADAHDIQPAWSPDGLTIAFQRTTASILADVWLMNADGGDQRPLMSSAPLAGSQLSPTWSPDGRLIAFTSSHESIGSAPRSYQVYTVWSDGSRLARRTFDSADKMAPVWISAPR